MKHPILSYVALSALLVLGVGTSVALLAADPRSGVTEASESVPAPEWKAHDLAGKELTSAEFKGKVTVVDFWATWCGPCITEIPGYINLQEKYRDRGLVIVGLSVDRAGPAVVKKFVEAKKINYPIAMAGDDAVSAFGDIEAIPTTFVVDREGRIRFKKTGAMPEAEFEKILQAVL